VDIINRNGNTNGKEYFKKRAGGYARGEARIPVKVQIHVERQKVNKECVNRSSIFVCNYLPFVGRNLHTNFTTRPQSRGFM
jgi:hypothetical protein